MTPNLVCPRCRQAITADHVIEVEGGLVAHVDCRRPRQLMPEECALLYVFCWRHPVASCTTCNKSFWLQDLAGDTRLWRSNPCPECHADLTESLRDHLDGCVLLPRKVRERTQKAHDTARGLLKQSQQLMDRADVLIREMEVALAALRDTIQRLGGRNSQIRPPMSARRTAGIASHGCRQP